MATLYTLQIAAGDIPQPVISGSRQGSANRLAKLFMKLAGGHQSGVTITARNTAVKASCAVTLSGVDASDTLTINGQALTATSQRARGTATCVSVVEDDTLTVAGVTFTVKDTPAGALEVETGGTDTLMAAAFAAAINANATTSAAVKATNAAGVVHIKALAVGTGGNAITLAKTGTTITVSGSGTLAGGAAVSNNQFDFHANFNDDTASALAECINASTTGIVCDHVTASASAAVVTVTAKQAGVSGNAITIAGNDADIAAATARLTGGSESLVTLSF